MRLAGSEEELCVRLSSYLRLRHPDVLFHFDFGAGTKLSMSQAVRQKRLNKRAWPDLFIARGVDYIDGDEQTRTYKSFKGLFIELKRDGTRLKRKDGTWANEHVMEQDVVLQQLSNLGYVAQFAVGFDDAVELIESYLDPSTEAVMQEAF
jgi:hypothetical protein